MTSKSIKGRKRSLADAQLEVGNLDMHFFLTSKFVRYNFHALLPSSEVTKLLKHTENVLLYKLISSILRSAPAIIS